MNLWIIILICLVVLPLMGVSLKAILYSRQQDWCPKIAKFDKAIKTKFEFLMERIIKFKELWFSIIFKTPKKLILFITLLLLVIGYAIEFLRSNVPFLNDILSFYPAFMDFLGIFFAGVTYLFTMIVGIFIYGDINYLIHDEKCFFSDKLLNTFLTFLNYLLSYILPLIIIVSLISSSANSMRNESTNNCSSAPGIQLDSNITNFLFLILTILLIATYVVFNHLNCPETGYLTQANSFLFTFLVLFIIIAGNLILVYFTIQNYTKLLTDTYLNIEYWILFGCSILIYLIQTIRGVNSKNLIENLFDKILTSLVTKCTNKKAVLFNMGEVRDKDRAAQFGMTKEDFKHYRKKQVRGTNDKFNRYEFGKTMFFGLKKPPERAPHNDEYEFKQKQINTAAKAEAEKIGKGTAIKDKINFVKSAVNKKKT